MGLYLECEHRQTSPWIDRYIETRNHLKNCPQIQEHKGARIQMQDRKATMHDGATATKSESIFALT